MNRFKLILAEAGRSVRASMSTTVAATMTVLVAMLVLGTTIGLGTWVLSYSNHIKNQLLIRVYFNFHIGTPWYCSDANGDISYYLVIYLDGGGHVDQYES